MDNLWTFSACAKTTQTSSTYEAVESSAKNCLWKRLATRIGGLVSVYKERDQYQCHFKHESMVGLQIICIFLGTFWCPQPIRVLILSWWHVTMTYDISEFMPILDFLMNSERHPSSSQVWPFWLHYVHCCNNFWLNRVCTVDGRAISSGGESLKLSSEYLDCQPGVPGFSKDHRCRNGGYHG